MCDDDDVLASADVVCDTHTHTHISSLYMCDDDDVFVG